MDRSRSRPGRGDDAVDSARQRAVEPPQPAQEPESPAGPSAARPAAHRIAGRHPNLALESAHLAVGFRGENAERVVQAPLQAVEVEVGSTPEPPQHLHSGGKRVAHRLERRVDDLLGGGVDERPGHSGDRPRKRVAYVGIGPGGGAGRHPREGPARQPGHRTRLQQPESGAVPGPLDVLGPVAVAERPVHAPDQLCEDGHPGRIQHRAAAGGVGPADPGVGSRPLHDVLLRIDGAADHRVARPRGQIDRHQAASPGDGVAGEGDAGRLGADHLADDHRARRVGVGDTEAAAVRKGVRTPERRVAPNHRGADRFDAHDVQRAVVDARESGAGRVLRHRAGAHGHRAVRQPGPAEEPRQVPADALRQSHRRQRRPQRVEAPSDVVVGGLVGRYGPEIRDRLGHRSMAAERLVHPGRHHTAAWHPEPVARQPAQMPALAADHLDAGTKRGRPVEHPGGRRRRGRCGRRRFCERAGALCGA